MPTIGAITSTIQQSTSATVSSVSPARNPARADEGSNTSARNTPGTHRPLVSPFPACRARLHRFHSTHRTSATTKGPHAVKITLLSA